MTTTRSTVTDARAIAAARFALHGFEGEGAGVESNFGAQAERLQLSKLSENAKRSHAASDPLSLSEMPIKSTSVVDWSNRSLAPERWADWGASRSLEGIHKTDARRAHEALAALASGTPAELRALRVLHLVLGPRPPGEDTSFLFGEVWPVAAYTDAVEAHRASLVAVEYARLKAHAERAQRAHNAMVAAFVPGSWVEAVTAPRECHLGPDAQARMRLSADRMITPGDALRSMFHGVARLSGNEARVARDVRVVRDQATALYDDAIQLLAARMRVATVDAAAASEARAARIAEERARRPAVSSTEPPATLPPPPAMVCVEDIERLMAASNSTARRAFEQLSVGRQVGTVPGFGKRMFVRIAPPDWLGSTNYEM
jgi:hypothetical protein